MLLKIIFIIIGYLFGSILFARIMARMLNKPGIIESSKDQNPGTANAFIYGGFLCGIVTLIGDLIKGFFPVYIYYKYTNTFDDNLIFNSLMIASPVIGHAFPLFYRFKGGKGIVVSFGSLLGLLPFAKPVLILASLFIIFSLILKISPHYYRTLVTYLVSILFFILLKCGIDVILGFVIITIAVCLRLYLSKEEKNKIKVGILWKH